MAKNAKKILVLVLTFVLCMVQVIAPAMADENTAGEPPAASTPSETPSNVATTTGTNAEGLTVTTTTTTDDSGSGTVTVTIEKDTEGTTVDGVVVDGTETTVKTTEGLTTSWEIDGTETREWVEEDDGNAPGQAVVTADLVPGEETTGEVVVETLTGDVPANPKDTTYDYTETATVDREITVTTGEEIVTIDNGGEVNLEAIGPDIYTENGSFADGDYQLGQYSDGTVKDSIYTTNNETDMNIKGTMEWDAEEGKWIPNEWTDGEGDFRYAGYGEQTMTDVYYKDGIEYVKDENGELVLNENGNAIIDEENAPIETSTLPLQFVLHDENGNIVYAYCIDLETGAVGGHYYTVSNLEDSDYYSSEDAENHLRGIVLNGYWGSANEQDADGNYNTGSIAAIRAQLAAAFEAGTLIDEDVVITETDGAGNKVEKSVKLSELMAGLTEGEALAVTQAAIWTYANGNPDILDGTASRIVVGAEGFSGDEKSKARLETFYNYLINLTAEKTETTVIDDTSFLEEDSLSLSVGDKNSNYEANYDDDDDNDVYDTALNFTLAFVPGDKDDLLVCVTYKDLDGNDQTIVKRLAGENGDDQSYETITPDSEGSYTISGLTLSENKDFNFDLKLEGVQYLEQGVYVYSPVGGRGTSQTFVSLAEGTREVEVSTELTISFDVDEDNKVVATRKWHDKGSNSRKPTKGNTNLPDEDVPLGGDPAEGDELTLLDEEVPLAAAPETGDNSIVYAVMSLFSLCGIILLARKRRVA